jgi:hypothetical protein
MLKTGDYLLQLSRLRWQENKIVSDDTLWGSQRLEVLNRFGDK